MYLQGVESIYDIVWTDGPRARHLRRRVPPERGRAVEVQLRARRHRVLLRHFDEHERACQAAARREAGAAGLRAGAQGLAHLQSARCAQRDLGDRAAALHPAGAHAGRGVRRGLLRRAARRSAFRCSRPPLPRPAPAHEARMTARPAGRARHRGAAAQGPAALSRRLAEGIAQGLGRRGIGHGGLKPMPRRGAWPCWCAGWPRAARTEIRRRGPPVQRGLRCRRRADACRRPPLPKAAARRRGTRARERERKGSSPCLRGSSPAPGRAALLPRASCSRRSTRCRSPSACAGARGPRVRAPGALAGAAVRQRGRAGHVARHRRAGNFTRGHRFMAPQRLRSDVAGQLRARLRSAAG